MHPHRQRGPVLSTITVLPGQPALSPFKLNRLGDQIREQLRNGPEAIASFSLQLKAVEANFLHIAELAEQSVLDQAQQSLLEQLLVYGPQPIEQNSAIVNDDSLITLDPVIVAPRAGTISPWSSKATDIAHNCGLPMIQRLERAIAYRLFFSSSAFSKMEEGF